MTDRLARAAWVPPACSRVSRRFCTLCTIKQENGGSRRGCPDRGPDRHAGRRAPARDTAAPSRGNVAGVVHRPGARDRGGSLRGAWRLHGNTSSTYRIDSQWGAFSGLFILALAIERALEPLSRELGPDTTRRKDTQVRALASAQAVRGRDHRGVPARGWACPAADGRGHLGRGDGSCLPAVRPAEHHAHASRPRQRLQGHPRSRPTCWSPALSSAQARNRCRTPSLQHRARRAKAPPQPGTKPHTVRTGPGACRPVQSPAAPQGPAISGNSPICRPRTASTTRALNGKMSDAAGQPEKPATASGRTQARPSRSSCPARPQGRSPSPRRGCARESGPRGGVEASRLLK